MLYLIISLSVVVFILLVLFILFMSVFYAGKNDDYNIPVNPQYDLHHDYMVSLIDNLRKLEYEDVYIKGYDKKRLHAKYYHMSDEKDVAICFHGYRGTAIRDFSGGSSLLIELKQNLLLIDERGQEKSKGLCMTFGVKERLDVKCWIDYAKERLGEDVRVSLYGVSMGAATILMASSNNYPNVKRIIADSPFVSPKEIISKVIKKDLHMPPKIFYPLVSLSALIYGHFRLNSVDAREEVKKTHIPILIIHGEDDRFVPCEMSDIKEYNPEMIERVTFPNAGHGISYLEDEERYKRVVK
ncbi:MAG: alpha/beta hydrolase, partial [Gammaproteobacteria bacterium]|nr:alpha/beta hydrolase [Gammaproteobacteria bacterium]